MISKFAARALAIIVGLVLLYVAPCTAQDATATKVDDFIKSEMQKQHIPGVALAVVKSGQVVLAKGYGYSNVEHQVPVKPETIFQSGSVGKQFTATAVMMLVEEGKINLAENLGKYLGNVADAWKNITVQHLLTHTAGMTDYPNDFDYRRDYTEDEMLKLMQTLPLAFQPGEKWQYSNLGYVTLGIIIHKVTGKFYGDFMQERIFKPLGMTTARIISESDLVPNRAAGYQLIEGELKNQDWVAPMTNTTADGALYLTALDMAKWDAALYGETLLKKTSFDRMWTAVKLNNGKTYPYGFGWSLGEVRGHRIIEHGGAWQGFKAMISRYVDDQLTVIVLANLSEANESKLARGVAAIYNPELAPLPLQPIEDKEPQVTARVKELLQKFVAGTADSNLFTKEAQAVIFPEGAQRFSELLKPLDTLNQIRLVERKDEDGLRVYRYRLTYKDELLLLAVSLTKEDKIAGIDAEPE